MAKEGFERNVVEPCTTRHVERKPITLTHGDDSIGAGDPPALEGFEGYTKTKFVCSSSGIVSLRSQDLMACRFLKRQKEMR